MPRVKRGPKRKNRRAKILKLAKGYYGMKSRGHRIAKEQVERGLNFAYAGRKDRKGEFRKLWIARINAAARINGISYSQLMAGLKAAGSTVDRKILADIAVRDAEGFATLARVARQGLKKVQSGVDERAAQARENAPKAAPRDTPLSSKEQRAAKQAAADK